MFLVIYLTILLRSCIEKNFWVINLNISVCNAIYILCIFAGDRLRDFDIILHDKPIIPNTGSNDHAHRVCHHHNGTLAATQLSVTCTHGEDYLSRYVMIILRSSDAGVLTLCEVEVYPGPKSGKYTTHFKY